MATTSQVRDSDSVPDRTGEGTEFSGSQAAEPVELRSTTFYPLLTDPSRQETAEYFGVLRTRLLNARAKAGFCSVLVASAQIQEGKTLICTNLAISLAQLARERILLVDGDLRMKGITTLLGLQRDSGLGDFLQGGAPFVACVRQTTLPHLSVSPAGNSPEALLPGLLEGPRWIEFLERAKQDFGLVIVDSVPISAPIADFELLLGGCDTALLVVRLRKTKWTSLDMTSQRLNGKLLGLVVNNMERPAGIDQYYRYRDQQKPAGKKPR
jgi:capsular exopolysaccharide synthesis family protein